MGFKITPKAVGRKGIVVETKKIKAQREVIECNHACYQGLLACIGNIKTYHFCLQSR